MTVVVNLVNKGLGSHHRALAASALCRHKLPVWGNGGGCSEMNDLGDQHEEVVKSLAPRVDVV
jgi:hypothetical protein